LAEASNKFSGTLISISFDYIFYFAAMPI